MRFMIGLMAAAAVFGAPAVAQEAEPTRVAFAADSDSLNATARARLDQLAATLDGSGVVIVAGHADRSEGSPEYEIGLSQRRANIVREYLVNKGVSPLTVVTEAFGSALPLADGQASQNRRVDVTVGPGSGW